MPPGQFVPGMMPGMMMPPHPSMIAPSNQALPTASTVGYMPQVDTNMLQRLIGPPINDYWRMSGVYGGTGNSRSKKPIPKWDGQNPAKTVKIWLKDLRMWRQETELPAWQHGRELQQSFEPSTWMRSAAKRAVSEEATFTEDAWRLILTDTIRS